MKTEVAERHVQVDAGRPPASRRSPGVAKSSKLPVDQGGDAHPRRRHRRRIATAVLEDREAVQVDVLVGDLRGVPRTLGGIAPDMIFGQVTDVVEDDKSKDTSEARPARAGRVHHRRRGSVARTVPHLRAASSPELIACLRRRVVLPARSAGRRTTTTVSSPARSRRGASRPRPDPPVRPVDRRSCFASASSMFIVGMFVIVVIAPAAFPLIAGARRAHRDHRPGRSCRSGTRRWNWSRARAGCRHREVPGGLRRPPRDPSPRRARRSRPRSSSKRAGSAAARAGWAITHAEHAHRDHQFLGDDDHALVLYRRATLVLERHPDHRHRGCRCTCSPPPPPAPLRQIGQFYNALLDVRVSWRRLCEPFEEPILPRNGADAVACPDSTVTSPSITSRSRTPTIDATGAPRRDVHDGPAGRSRRWSGYTGAGKSSIAKLLGRTYDPDGRQREASTASTSATCILDTLPPASSASYRRTRSCSRARSPRTSRTRSPDATDEEVESGDPRRRCLGPAVGAARPVRARRRGRGHTTSPPRSASSSRSHGRGSREPDILVLDESTSLLDTEVEDIIVESIHALGCTTLMITHRESIAVKSDNIVVLDAGRVVDAGPEEQVCPSRRSLRPALARPGRRARRREGQGTRRGPELA